MAERLAFVDTHVHFWERPHPKLDWVWLAPDAVHPLLGPIPELKALTTFTSPQMKADAAGANVTKIVHVQAAIGSADPVDETEWLQAMADETGWPNGITADARLQDSAVEGVIERHAEYANLRGLRDFAEGDYLVDPNFHRGYALLEKYNLVYDLDCTWENMAKARDLANKFPNITLILDHAGFPQERTPEYFADWQSGVAALAEADNAVVKISGLGMGDQMAGQNWTIESIRPYVMGCIEAFGVERSFFGSNWPVDRTYSDYPTLIDAYTDLVGDFSTDEQVALFSGNAERIYRI
ncbi:MAG: amidohydrolase family protein [Acidimicrobiia bacterium]|nr:amidohydrolase family protein [Acidimicrobiia bacterium]